MELEAVTAEALYLRAKLWAVDAYVSAQDVVQLEDEKAGRLVVKGGFPASTPWFGGLLSAELADGSTQVVYTLRIEVKAGRYRYIMTDFRAFNQSIEEFEDSKFARKFRLEVAGKAQTIIESLKAAMTQSSAEDW